MQSAKVKIEPRNYEFGVRLTDSFYILQFAFCILQLIARNP